MFDEDINTKIKGRQSEDSSMRMLSSVLDEIGRLADRKFPEDMEINNLDEVKSHLRNELGKLATRLEKALKAVKVDLPRIKISETIKISNISELATAMEKMKNASELLSDLSNKMLEYNPNVNVNVPDVIVPDINVPEIKIPKINVPTPKVTVNTQAPDLGKLNKALDNLKYLSDRADKPLSVRMSDGKKFVKALQAVAKKSAEVAYAFSNSGGMTVDEYKATNKNSDDILAKYQVADKDDDASPNYYGFLAHDGDWYILKEVVSAGADTYRYIKGSTDYATNWTGRAGLSYGYFSEVF